MRLNNKGYTLVEILAVIVILSILMAIMVPSVNYLIEKNKEDNYMALENSILSAAKVYLSDNRYNITLNYGDNLCSNGETEELIANINGINLTDSKLSVKLLVDSKNLTVDSEGKIYNPKDKEKTLDLNDSYVLVKYKCSTKDYTYTIEENSLIWE